MTDPKTPSKFQDELRPSHDLLETARTIELSPTEQEDAVEREVARRVEAAARAQAEAAEAERQRAEAERMAAIARRNQARRWFFTNAIAYVAGNAALFAVDKLTSGGTWFYWPLIGWSVLLAGHAVWLIARAEAIPQAPAPYKPISPEEMALLSTSKRLPAPRPLAGRGKEEAEEEARERARITQRRRPE